MYQCLSQLCGITNLPVIALREDGIGPSSKLAVIVNGDVALLQGTVVKKVRAKRSRFVSAR